MRLSTSQGPLLPLGLGNSTGTTPLSRLSRARRGLGALAVKSALLRYLPVMAAVAVGAGIALVAWGLLRGEGLVFSMLVLIVSTAYTGLVLVRVAKSGKRVVPRVGETDGRYRDLVAQLSKTAERERRTIARHLHDNVGQLLAIAKIRLGLLAEQDPSPGVSEVLEDVSDLMDQAIAQTRALTSDLCPPILYEAGLEAAVVWLGAQWHKRHGLRVAVVNNGWPKALPEDLRSFLFQTVRELLTNVVKHARAGEVRIELRANDRGLMVSVEDDGIGPGDATHSAGFGLFSIRERISYYGGSACLERRERGGTRVRLEIPPQVNGAAVGCGSAVCGARAQG